MTYEPSALLQVTVLHARDVAAASAGGADRLLLAGSSELGPPQPAAVSAAVRATDLPVRVVLDRPDADLAREYLELGAEGLAFGLLDRDLDVDRDRCLALVTDLQTPWHFTGIDGALDADRAWRDVRTLPWLDGVASAGSSRGFAVGAEDLLGRARADRGMASLLVADGGLVADQVPWLVRAGVRQFAVGAEVRAGESWTRGGVDAARVRSWRLLLDDALSRALGVPVE